jgi:hypothetical protein
VLLRKSRREFWLGSGLAVLLLLASGNHEAWGDGVSEATPGTVVETMNAAGYTYVLVDSGKEQVWFAAPGFSVAVGNKVVAPAGAQMRDHYSKTLDRTFEVIYFVGGIHVEGAPNQPANSPFRHPDLSGAKPAGEIDFSGITRVEGGKSIAEIFDGGSELAGHDVAVRGRVMKFSPRILETNFLHLQDGTSSKDGRNDLTVTSKTVVEVGSVVVVRGVLSANKDLGSGYTYDLIIMDASVTAE